MIASLVMETIGYYVNVAPCRVWLDWRLHFKDMLKELPYAETMEDIEKLLSWNFKCKDVKTP